MTVEIRKMIEREMRERREQVARDPQPLQRPNESDAAYLLRLRDAAVGEGRAGV